ncbi:hypothetical protein CTAYLR_006420 [Chrysophaeum taylorii]|uniref:PI3K/PI4K catalytic domain-containing protein n=1 Tax=Chrysophaeum taylorii TaxID=2483200 RepID=A0AAD7UBW1_9STRA|nr:hypothetical protein CTAYLR_006420 [Chrysophaeum taylorii]
MAVRAPWRWRERMRLRSSLFVIEALALLRIIVLVVLVLPSVGARCSKRALAAWSGGHLVVACGAVVVTAWRASSGRLGAHEGAAAVGLCCLSVLSCRFLRGAIDYVRSDRAPVLDVYLYAGEHFSRLARAVASTAKASTRRRSCGCYSGAQREDATAALIEPEAEPKLRAALRRFAERSASIRGFWNDRLALELGRARRIARDFETRGRDLFLDTPERRRQKALDEVFSLLIRLFAHEDVLGEIRDAFRGEPSALVFHSLQLAAFALFGAYWDGPALRRCLLDLCAADAYFAHRVEFYLRAFATPETPGLRLTPEAADAVVALRTDVKLAAAAPATKMRAVFATTRPDDDENDDQKESDPVVVVPPRDDDDDDAFDEMPRLVDTLTAISRDLCGIERRERNEVLRARLEAVNRALLPSRAAYVPCGSRGRHERVTKIHAIESKVFSTKERCPYLACLEVELLDDDPTPSSRLLASAICFAPAATTAPSRSEEACDDEEPLGQWRSSNRAESGDSSRSGSAPRVEQQQQQQQQQQHTYGALRAEDDAAPPKEEALASRRSFDSLASRRSFDSLAFPTVVFRECWADKEARLLGEDRGRRRLVPVIVKARDDLRQEQFASQLIAQAAAILEAARVPVWLRPYDVVATGPDAGVIEAVPDSVSLDALRRNDSDYVSLVDFFDRHFGRAGLAAARSAFVESLAPACIISYLLQLKDRHNGNLLIDARGHLFHIDFGYMLASSPGGNFGFESAPFKLTNEFLELVGPDFRRFKDLCVRTFLALRRERHRLILLAEMTVRGCEHLPCFDGRPRETIDALRRRFKPNLADRKVRAFVHGLIDKSTNNWRTSLYDEYQRRCVGIL